jgi:hypothetical protein
MEDTLLLAIEIQDLFDDRDCLAMDEYAHFEVAARDTPSAHCG